MADPKATGQTKRWRARMALMQNVLRAKESHARTGEALDNLTRLLVEEEMAAAESTAPPDSPRPTMLTGDAFSMRIRTLFADAKTDADRQAVRDLISKAYETGTISEAERETLETELRQ